MKPDYPNIFKKIDIKELLDEAPFLYIFENDDTAHNNLTMNSIAYFQANENLLFMSAKKPDMNKIKPSKTKLQYWEPVKKQFHLLICTDDQRYDDLREKIKSFTNDKGNSLLIIIAAYLGEKIGCEPVTIISLCSIVLYSIIKLHKEAICDELKK